MKNVLFFLFFLFFHIETKAQLDLEHWFPPVFRSGGNVDNAFISLSTDKISPFKIFIYNANTIIDSVTIDSNNPIEYNLGIGAHLLAVYTGSITDTMTPINSGIHLVGENSFYANLKYTGSNTEIISSKGKTGLGKKFYIVNDQNILQGSNNPNQMNYQASITAYNDNTQIKISNYNNDLKFINGSDADEINITLNKNQTYIIAALKKDNTQGAVNDYFDPHLIGALITSNKSITVTNGNFLSQDAGDIGGSINIDQSIPTDKLGKEYLLINGMSAGNLYMEKALIVATEDDTKIFFNDENTPLFILNKGEHYIGPYQSDKKFIPSSQPPFTNEENRLIPTSSMFIKSNKPFYCYQLLATFHDKPIDPKGYIPQVGRTSAMLFSYPLDKEYKIKNITIPFIDDIGGQEMRSKLSIKSEKNANIKINGLAISVGSDIIGKPGWVYHTIQNSKGNLTIQSDKSLNVDFVGGTTKAYSQAYSGYAGSVVSYSNDPFITLNGNCIEEGLLLKLNNTDFDKIQWQKDEIDIPGATTATYIPTESGIYSCVLTYSGINFKTNSFNIANCPYTVVDKDFGNICDDLLIVATFSPPNESQIISKLEILSQPFNGKVTIDNLNLKYIPDTDFTGDDRFVYKICTATSGLCETVKANVFVNEKPQAEIISELYPTSESAGKGKYDLTKVIINQTNYIYEFYEDTTLTQKILIPKHYETALLKVFLKIQTISGCFIVKEINLLVLEENIKLANFFSPNGDGINDVWDYSKLKNYSNLELVIYDKYGRKVYEHSKNNLNFTWNGKINNTGNLLNSDSYWSIIRWQNTRTFNTIIKQSWIVLKSR